MWKVGILKIKGQRSKREKMGLPLSMDLRKRIIECYEEKQEVKKIVKNLRVKKSAVYNLINLYKETGQYAPRERNPGRKPSLTEKDYENIRAKIAEEPDVELATIKAELNLKISVPWLCNIINYKLKLPRKKKRYITVSKTAKT